MEELRIRLARTDIRDWAESPRMFVISSAHHPRLPLTAAAFAQLFTRQAMGPSKAAVNPNHLHGRGFAITLLGWGIRWTAAGFTVWNDVVIFMRWDLRGRIWHDTIIVLCFPC